MCDMEKNLSKEVLAYLAGAIDSDGSIGVRRSTYAARHGDGRQATYSERICFKQVTPDITDLLKATFGGSVMIQKPSVTKGRQLHYWEATNQVAATALQMLLPYLRVKREQAENALALRASKSLPRSQTHTHREPSISQTGTGAHAIRRLEVSVETMRTRELIYARAKELNRVGVRAV